MALLPARRNSTLSRPGLQPPARWDPFAEFEDLYQRIGQLLGGAFGGGWPPPVQGWAPPADLSETDEAYLAEVELPGVARDDISVELAGPELVISGEFTDTGKEGRALRRGRRSGRFEYRVLLPGQADPDPDKVTAALADGVLTVTVPKAEAGKHRRIQITAG
ncbi:MAG TPA: Hsp20/alpha crystallin family protein [Streptosporangiaceae bacterium]|nr:Hsp20/alpha crystallin family protein [Streptosporangiaceae bacterium]